MKYLIEEFQDIGYGSYKNWFASRQVERLYHLIEREEVSKEKANDIITYLKQVAKQYNNEVGATAQMSLAQYYAMQDKQEKVDELIESIEQRLTSIDNPKFKEDKWMRVKTRLESIKNRNEQTASMKDRDTLFYEVQPNMIDQMEIYKDDVGERRYRINVLLKKEYHPEFAVVTSKNIGNFLAVTYQEEMLASGLPTIQTGISEGRFSLGPYEKKKKAEQVLRRISD
ncbi:hypothetical protein [Fodinibius sp.]|uniref:hypothetical protein n=1 Tax=Fodinibius sp. TaxID=1872440 RepID=UPI002ACEB863|nr:hypothetical protein [Fodinibius sp.]MDZ7659113.1 hypothetical protein [Fodinibius sp.]